MKITSSILAISCVFASPAFAATVTTPFTSMPTAPGAEEAAVFDLINQFRADPYGEVGRLLNNPGWATGITASTGPSASDGTGWAAGFWAGLDMPGSAGIGSSLDFFNVNPGDLLNQWSSLATPGTLMPYVWDNDLGSVALQYNQLMINDNLTAANPHEIAPYAPYGFARYTDGGYAANSVGENLFKKWDSTRGLPYAHAGFAVDWGFTANGIQNPAGHRNSLLSNSFTEIGLANDNALGYDSTATGYGANDDAMTQQFGYQSADRYAYGYLFQDADSDSSYDLTEALAGQIVELYDPGTMMVVGTATTDSNGGYVFDLTGNDTTSDPRSLSGGGVLGTIASALSPANYEVRLQSDPTISNSLAYDGSSRITAVSNLAFVAPVPEPSRAILIAIGLVAMISRRRRS